MKDGRWLVPPEQRPVNWQEILPEPQSYEEIVQLGSSVLDQVVTETQSRTDATGESAKAEVEIPQVAREEPRVERQHQRKGEPWNDTGWKKLRRSVEKSAKNMGADRKLTQAALVLCSGMYTRTGPVIRKMTGVSNEKPIVNRCYELGLWKRNESGVILGEMKEEHGDLEFWLIAMAINGEIYRHADGKLQSLESLDQGSN